MRVRNKNIGTHSQYMTPKTSIMMYHIGGPQSTQRWPKLTRIHVLEVQNHLLALNAITQKSCQKYHRGYTRCLHKL